MTAVTPGAVSAESYAARKIAACLNQYIDPDIKEIADDSGLTEAEVRAMVEKLHAKRMQTPGAKVATPKPSEAKPALVFVRPPEGAAQPAWRAAHDHPSKRIRTLAARAESAIATVEAALAADAEKAALREKKAKLLAQLAKVQAELHDKPAPEVGAFACPKCDRTVRTPKGLAIHVGRDHKEEATA